jgi:hypothetical protein
MQPYLKNTPRGGKKMAIRMSQHVAKPPPFPMMMSSSNCTRQTKFLETVQNTTSTPQTTENYIVLLELLEYSIKGAASNNINSRYTNHDP